VSKAKRVAQVLSGRVPLKEWRGAWAAWNCPVCEEDFMTLDELPAQEDCVYCKRVFVIYDPKAGK
jgi:hypothetical protein